MLPATLVTFASFLLELSTSSPVYNMQPAFITANIGTTGRNIRNLPCISRKTNQNGVCMFAIDCLKSNGTHLGTCIDRFYFGSCCHVEPIHDIIDNNIDTDIIPAREPPMRLSSTIKPVSITNLPTTTIAATITAEASSQTITQESSTINYKLSTFQSVDAETTTIKTSTTPKTTTKTKPAKVTTIGTSTTKKPTLSNKTNTTTKVKLSTTQKPLTSTLKANITFIPNKVTTIVTTKKPTKKPTVNNSSIKKPSSSTKKPSTVTKKPTTLPVTTLQLKVVNKTTSTTTSTTPTTTISTTKLPSVSTSTSTTTTLGSIVTWTLPEEKNPSTAASVNTSSTTSTTNAAINNTTEDWVPITTPDNWVPLPSVQPSTTQISQSTQNTQSTQESAVSTESASKPSITYLPSESTISSVTINSTSANHNISTTSTEQTTPTPITTPTEEVRPVNMSDFTDVCGRRMFPEGRIVGGEKASFGKWPWQISLRQWRTSTYLHKCGAALLNENWAITAAHCVDNVPPSDLLLRLGEHDLSTESEPYIHQERRVQIVASHPQFDPRTFEYDLALLRFYEPVTFQPNILPVCVPQVDENFVGRTAYVTGWGRLYEDGPLPSILQEVSVPVINNSVCESMYRSAGYIEHIPHIFICAGWRRGGFDSCEGDSGGPMVIQRDDKRFLLAGVISWGIGCAEPNQPGVYTRISEFRDWINQILQF